MNFAGDDFLCLIFIAIGNLYDKGIGCLRKEELLLTEAESGNFKRPVNRTISILLMNCCNFRHWMLKILKVINAIEIE